MAEEGQSGKIGQGAVLFIGILHPAIHSLYFGNIWGIRVNEKAQVLNVYGEVVPGLYGAGEILGGVLGAAYMTGTAFGKALIFRRLAAKSILS